MDALLMCGGRGTRLEADAEKPLFEVGGRPMVDRVLEALDASRVGTVHAVVSPHVPETRAHLEIPTIRGSGEGYVADLRAALERVDPPVATAAADLPLLAGDAVDAALDVHETRARASTTVCVPAALKRRLGASLEATVEADGRELAPTGLNVVGTGGTETMHTTYDARLAVNVNRRSDAEIAEALL